MNLSDVANRVKTIFGSSSTIERAQLAREDRASVVLTLRQDVRGLQQEITDLSRAGESTGDATETPTDTAQLASLQRRLGQKQAELARYQARI